MGSPEVEAASTAAIFTIAFVIISGPVIYGFGAIGAFTMSTFGFFFLLYNAYRPTYPVKQFFEE